MRASLPIEFLQKIAEERKLSIFEREAFVVRLSNMDKTDLVVAKILNISRDRYSSRMTGVYKKFNISGKGAGKANTLFFKVFSIYEKKNPYASYDFERKTLKKLVSDTQVKIHQLIENKCASMKILDMNNPVEIQQIFTEVKIRKQIYSNRRVDIDVLNNEKNNNSPQSEKYLVRDKISGLDVVKQYQRLMILGKPGAGKTTFLKHIALLSQRQSDDELSYVPVFVVLKDFCAQEQEQELKDYVFSEFKRWKVDNNNLEILIEKGKFIFLLDGLDEVQDSKVSYVFRQIKVLSQFFPKNRFIVTCRLAAQAQDYKFENFTEVEICDFNNDQVNAFVENWFAEKGKPEKAKNFMSRILKEPKIHELSTSPLLLTLLCIVFEDSGGFPLNRAELYEEGIDVLLSKWDANRDIYRRQIYEGLSRQKKEDLLSYIAFNSFEKNEYFFKQKSIENEIREYVYNLPRSIKSSKNIDVDCRDILRSIEAQHGLIIGVAKGVYSFSHLTFHEYFASKKIVKSVDPDEQKKILSALIEHLYEPRWREIFLLVSCMLPKADYFVKLIKRKNDSLVIDEKIKDFFLWLKRKSDAISVYQKPPYMKSIGQILYFQLAISSSDLKGVKHVESRDFKLDSGLSVVLNQGLNILQDVEFSTGLLESSKGRTFLKKIRDSHNLIYSTLLGSIDVVFDGQLRTVLQTLSDELCPDDNSSQWWGTHGKEWIDRLVHAIVIRLDS